MKRIYLLLISISTNIILLAQRERAMPEDYMDYPDYSSSSSYDTFIGCASLILLIIMGIGLLWFKSALNSSRKEEIRNKTVFLTNRELYGYEWATMLQNHSAYKNLPKEYFRMENNIVKIPKYAKCRIILYYKENRSYVLVKFEDYPTTLYIDRGSLRTPDQIDK